MHGITRQRSIQSGDTSEIDIRKVVVRYADGRSLNFVPEAGRENFSEDDMLELKKVLTRASAVAEWAEASN